MKINSSINFRLANYFFLAITFSLPLTAIIYLSALYTNNIPAMDDYTVILKNLIILNDPSVTIQKKLIWLFSFHNEHRLAIPRLLSELNYLLYGKVSIKILTLWGVFAWLGCIVIFIFEQRKYLEPASLFIAGMIIASPYHAQNLVWATSSIQNLAGLLFVFISFYCISNDHTKIAIASSAIAILTTGGAIFCIVANMLYLLLSPKHKPKVILFHYLIYTLIIFTFFYGYSPPKEHAGISFVLHNLHQATLYFFYFLGNITAGKLGIFLGFCLLCCYGLQWATRYYLKNPTIFLLSSFVVLTACAATLNRSGYGSTQAFASRYTIYTIIHMACSFAFLKDIAPSYIPKKYRALSSQSITIAAFILASVLYTKSIKNAEYLMANQTNNSLDFLLLYKSFGNTDYLPHPNKTYATSILSKAKKAGIYELSDSNSFRRTFSTVELYKGPALASEKTKASAIIKEQNNHFVHISGWAFGKSFETKKIYLLLAGHNRKLKLSTNTRIRPDITATYGGLFNNLDDSGFEAYIETSHLPKDSYNILVLLEGNNGKIRIGKTFKTLNL